MTKKSKRQGLSLEQMREIARQLTQETLRAYPPPWTFRKEDLVLGSGIFEGKGGFELYIPAERPEDAKVITRVEVDSQSGEATIEVFLDRGGPP